MSDRTIRSLAGAIVAAAMTTPYPVYDWDEVDRRLAYRHEPKKRVANPGKKASRKRQRKARAVNRGGGK